jgi:hypothetical protein
MTAYVSDRSIKGFPVNRGRNTLKLSKIFTTRNSDADKKYLLLILPNNKTINDIKWIYTFV